MMKLFFPVALAVLLLASCKPGNAPLPEKEMEQILLDINIAESYSTIVKDSMHKPGIKNIDSLSAYYKEIFAHYKITPEQFTESLNWYKAHPEELDSMYSKIITKAIALQNSAAR